MKPASLIGYWLYAYLSCHFSLKISLWWWENGIFLAIWFRQAVLLIFTGISFPDEFWMHVFERITNLPRHPCSKHQTLSLSAPSLSSTGSQESQKPREKRLSLVIATFSPLFSAPLRPLPYPYLPCLVSAPPPSAGSGSERRRCVQV